jgi:hypothetical protein
VVLNVVHVDAEDCNNNKCGANRDYDYNILLKMYAVASARMTAHHME